jgi:hypothetical protein
MAQETTNPGYIDAQAYATDPDNVDTPDSLHQEYERGINSYSLSQDGDSAKLNALITADTVNSFVGINEATPLGSLHVKSGDSGAASVNASGDDIIAEGTGDSGMTILSGTAFGGSLFFGDLDNTAIGSIAYDHVSNSMSFGVNAANALKIDSAQNVGMGETTPLGKLHVKSGDSGAASVNASGDEIVVEGSLDSGITILSGSASGGTLFFGDSSDTDVGSINYSHASNSMSFGVNTLPALTIDSAQNLRAGSDNSLTLGTASFRWSEVFAGNGTINTSDEREKTIVTDDSKVLDAVDTIDVKAFKWNDSIDAKGLENARIHYGVIAQEVKVAFEAQGLVAEDYGILCYDEWDAEYETVVDVEGVPEILDEDGNVVESAVPPVYKQGDLIKEAGNRYGVRYDELYALKIACLERKIAAL